MLMKKLITPALLFSMVCAFVCPPAFAAPINYLDFVGTNVTYKDVTEDSATDPTPLWGAPTISGDGLNFTPLAAFSASSSGGSPPDITDGKLDTTIVVNDPGVGAIDNILVSERGDYTLAGSGTIASNTSVAAPVILTLLEINGVGISPTPLYSGNLMFSPSGGTYDLVNDPGSGEIWTGSLMIDIDAAMAAINKDGRATKIKYHMDNTLTAFSESGSIAFIAKKDGIVSLEVNVPEPTSFVLALLGPLGLAWVLRRRSR
jgi:hypothetical protein